MFPPYFLERVGETEKQACLQCASNQPHTYLHAEVTYFYQPAQQPPKGDLYVIDEEETSGGGDTSLTAADPEDPSE